MMAMDFSSENTVPARRKAGDTFRVNRMERIYDDAAGQPDVPHRHDYYTVIWVLQGEGWHRIDFEEYPLAPNHVFFVSPGQVHQMITQGRPYGWVITFSRDFLARNHIEEGFLLNVNLFRGYGDSPPLAITAEVAGQLEALMVQMEEVSKGTIAHKYAALGALLKLFLIYCNQVCSLPDDDFETATGPACVLRDFKSLVEQHFRTEHKVAAYADRLHLSAKYLSEVVKNLIGKSAKQYIQDRIVIEAKRLLRFSGSSVKEIAYDLGFEEPLHFSGFFKKCAGMSPSAFRES
jgi:AraC family transcriptional regulator, transcriptional activator of pobA